MHMNRSLDLGLQRVAVKQDKLVDLLPFCRPIMY